jgi:hypothetical protein
MSRLIPAAERITKARALIQKAREVEVPAETGRGDFSYVAQIKDLLQQARDLVKFLSYNPGVSAELKKDAMDIFKEADQVDRELLHR